ncbi:MAG: NAD(P)H-hydrate dehydratase [Lentisphaeria bacterium]|nr:NAD(P)H-hydrate dehydratase [Lentisphaeria bacterium]
MKAVSGTQMHELDQRTIRECGISGEHLMNTAGLLAGGVILDWLTDTGLGNPMPKIVVLAGKGNNGGDAFVVAKLLADMGYTVSLHCISHESRLSGDALTMFQRLPMNLRCDVSYSLSKNDLADSRTVVIDGLLGTGFHGTLREPYRAWCAAVNRSGLPVIALDIPSGLDADSGKADPDAVIADLTVTMAAPKTGMFSDAGIHCTGLLRTVDIGIPAAFYSDLPDTQDCTGAQDVKNFLKREDFDAHKYTRGHLFIAGGCRLYPGAPLLASEAALRSGAGLVSCWLPEQAEFYASVPKALIVRRLPGSSGFFSAESAEALLPMLGKAGALVVGPGIGSEPGCADFVERLLPLELPLLLDADALNLLSRHPEWVELLQARRKATVLTPHAGELKRLTDMLKLKSEDYSRATLAVETAKRLNAYVVSKGARTLVTAPDGRSSVNLSGCPALATAGTGDLLSGMTGAFLLNRQLNIFDAVRTAVFLHGYAAEQAAPIGSRGWIADDFPAWIGPAMRKLRVNA